MKAKNCLIFGGTGQIGRNLIRKLAKNNYKVTVITRNAHTKGNFIKTQANAGYIDIVEAQIFDEKKLRDLFKKSDASLVETSFFLYFFSFISSKAFFLLFKVFLKFF